MPKGRKRIMSRTKAPPPASAAPAPKKTSHPPAAAVAAAKKSSKPAALTLVKGDRTMILENGKTRANPEVLRKAAKILGVKPPSTRGAKSDQELLGSIRLELTKRLAVASPNSHVKCPACGEVSSDEDTPFCPFCGDEGTDPNSAASPDDVAVQPAAPVVGVGIAKTPVPTANVEVATEALVRDLESHVDRIKLLGQQTVSMSYEIGLLCKAIRDKQLYKAKGHKSFTAFAAAKGLPFARETALRLIGIVENHSKDDYDKIGYAKLSMLSAIGDVGVKAELLQAVREKPSITTRELAERVGRASSLPKKMPPSPEKEKGEKITLIGRIGARNQVVPFHDLQTGEVVDAAGTFKTFSENVYGELEVADGVYVRIGMRVSDDKQLKGLTVRFVRADAAE